MATKTAGVRQLVVAIQAALKNFSMNRSYEIKSINDETTFRVIMRPNERWFRVVIEEIERSTIWKT